MASSISSSLPPTIQWGVEGKIGFVDRLHELPGERTEADLTAGSFLHELVSYQHPDHDTQVWPPEDRV